MGKKDKEKTEPTKSIDQITRETGRIGMTLVDLETDEEFEAFTYRLSGALRDRVQPTIKKDEAARRKLEQKHEEYRHFLELGKKAHEDITCPECEETITLSGEKLQIQYYQENRTAIVEQSEDITSVGRELNVGFFIDMAALIIDPDHPCLEIDGDPERTKKRREWIRSKSSSEFWRSQPLPFLEQAVRRFRATLHLG